MLKKAGAVLFRNRSYTPIPFIVLMLLFINSNPLSLIAGFLIMVTGELIRIWAVGYAGSETRTTGGVGGSTLVTQGPYSVVRNPLYAGNVIIYSGVGIMSFSLFPYLQIIALVYFIFQYYCIILNEEEYLEKTFSDSFSIYKQNVNRIFPSFKKVPDEINSRLKFSIKEGIASERRTFTSFLIIVIIILFFYFFKIKFFSF